MSETAQSKTPASPKGPKPSSYQVLLEGQCEVLVRAESEEAQELNISELLRDLYTKHYALSRALDTLTKRVEALDAKAKSILLASPGGKQPPPAATPPSSYSKLPVPPGPRH